MSDKDEKTPNLPATPETRKMSSSLKGRTRLLARSFSSPLSRPDAVQFQSENKTGSVLEQCTSLENAASKLPSYSLEDIQSCSDQHLLLQMHTDLKKQVCDTEKKLKNLELVERYHLKHKPDDLVVLIKKWLNVSQASLRKLYEKMPEDKGNFQALLNMLNISNDIVQYNPENDTFF